MKGKTGAELLEQALLLDDIFESVPCGLLVLDSRGTVVRMNRHQEMISKKPRESVLGTPFHETWKRVIEGDTYGGKYWELLSRGTPFSVVFNNVLPQFYEMRVSGIARGVPLSTGNGFLLLHDLSEEVQRANFAREGAMSQISESLEFMREILDSSPNAVVTANEEGFITLVNSTVRRTFGYTKAELIWENIARLFQDPEAVKQIAPGDPEGPGVEVRCKKKGGETFPARMRVQRIRTKGGEPHSNLYLFVDISREREMELSLLDRLRFETLLTELSATFVNVPATQIDNLINEGIVKICAFMGASRGGLLQITNDSEGVAITHSWAMEGVEPVPVTINREGIWPWMFEKTFRGEHVHLRTPSDLPEEAKRDRQSMERFGVKSVIIVPLVAEGRILGSLAFSAMEEQRWPEGLVKRLRLCGEIYANAILRKRAEESLQKAFSEIRELKDQIESERNYLREEIRLEHNFADVIGRSRAIRAVLHKVEQVAPTDATVIIMGETGTGKELIARAIHDASRRSDKPLVKVDCAALPSNLIESELFGHEKGAFSGAHSRHVGRFEIANGGTLFLDEIGELPLEVQAKLLRGIQEGAFERLGSTRTIHVDARIIAATNRDLSKEMASGRFREDLWYRLHVFPIIVPPLRDRREDIALLVNAFVKRAAKKLGRPITRIPAETMKALEDYSWPGNVRELVNVVERAVINTEGSVLRVADALRPARPADSAGQKPKTLEALERDHIVEVLHQTRWRISGDKGAAVLLGLHPNTLRGRMLKLGIRMPWSGE
ncbi:MAG: sigma 54-interacting transcriptional regulator [bacterium]